MSEFNTDESQAPNDQEAVFLNAEDVIGEVDLGEAPPEESDDEDVMEHEKVAEEEAEAPAIPPEDHARMVLAGHNDSVYSVAIARGLDGVCLFATGSGDDSASLWRWEGAALEQQVLGPHRETVASVAFSTDANMLATGDLSGVLKLWSTGENSKFGDFGAEIRSLDGPADVEWIDWHPRGRIVLAGASDGTIWMWLADNGNCMQVFAGHEGGVSGGGFSADGNTVVSSGLDGTLRLWAPRTGRCKHTFSGHGFHEGPITCLSIEKGMDAQRVLTGSMDGTLRLSHTGTKRVLQTFVHSSPEVRPSSRQATAVNREAQDEMDMDDEENAVEESTLSVECCEFLTGSGLDWVVSGGVDGVARVWDVTSGSIRAQLVHSDVVTGIKRGSSSQPIFISSCADGVVRVWETRNGGNCLRELTGHGDMIVDLSVFVRQSEGSRNEAIVVTGSDDHTGRVFLVPTD